MADTLYWLVPTWTFSEWLNPYGVFTNTGLKRFLNMFTVTLAEAVLGLALWSVAIHVIYNQQQKTYNLVTIKNFHLLNNGLSKKKSYLKSQGWTDRYFLDHPASLNLTKINNRHLPDTCPPGWHYWSEAETGRWTQCQRWWRNMPVGCFHSSCQPRNISQHPEKWLKTLLYIVYT